MAGYVIALIDVTDEEAYKEYVKRTPAAIAKYGGKILVRGGRNETIEGPQAPKRIVVIEFPSFEAAKAMQTSPEYAEAKKFRMGAATGQFIVVEGAD